jgi:nucleotide-binding universal stress UspA family protein
MIINERIIFKRILCPIDLTPESDESLRYGIALAKAYGAKLSVINCVDGDAVDSVGERKQIEEQLDTAVRKHLRLPVLADFTWESLVVTGDPKTTIAQEAAERRIDLIVMRSRRRPYAAALLGSMAESVCRTAPCPVMITHPREQDWAGVTTNEIGLQRVLVAYDFSSDSELALAYGLSLAQEYQAEIHVLHVLPTRPSRSVSPQIAFARALAESGFLDASSRFDASSGLLDASSRLKDAVPAETSVWCEVKQAVREGHPYREVLVYADEQNIDLICIGASGAGFGMRALFGSNADRVLRQAPCPVLIARPLKPALTKLNNHEQLAG